MKDMMIRGRYFEVDFSKAKVISKADKKDIHQIIDDILKEELSIYTERYSQGFLDVTNPEILERIPDILSTLTKQFINQIDFDLSLEKNILMFIKYLENSLAYDEDIIGYIWEILYKLQAKMHFKPIEKTGPTLLKMLDWQPQYLFEIPKNVVGIICEERPTAIELDILESKSIPHIITKQRFKIGSSQKLSRYDLGILPGLGILDKKISKNKRGKFRLGVSIHKKSQIKDILNVEPDYIIVEPEKSYINFGGVASLGRRQTFYKLLFESFPNTEILIILPKLGFLDTYFNLGNDIKMDITSLMNHTSLFETELRALFSYDHNHISVSIPDIEDVEDFNRLRTYLQESCLAYLGKKLDVGIEINTSYTKENIWCFKKFSHAIINLNRGYDSILPKTVDSPKYALKYSDVRHVLYRKSKTMYLMGKDLNKPKVLQKFMYRGFKNFTIKPELFDLFSSIIYRYNQDRGL